MSKKQKYYLSIFSLLVFVFSFSLLINLAQADESGDNASDSVDLIVDTYSNEEESVDIDDFTDEELTEAEPSELPEAEADPALTQRLYGRMLLDTEGNGEIYYLDPVTGEKEYLADGAAAHHLLERRALGINEENFAKLIIGEDKNEDTVCASSDLGNRLKGRIVLRVQKAGEAYYVSPDNCRVYYAGTHDAAYQLMRNFGLGILKKDLAKIPNNKRQRVKNALRYTLYAYAEDNNVDLETARQKVREEVQSMHQCMLDSGVASSSEVASSQRREQAIICASESDLPEINQARRQEIREMIQETRQERHKIKNALKNINFGAIVNRVKARRNNSNQ